MYVNDKWFPDLTPKGYEILDCYTKFVLVTGPRWTSKTTCIMSKIARHLWEVDGAKVAIIGKTLRNIKSSGIWQDLIELPTGMQQWLNSPIGFKYSVAPKMTGDTKMTFFRIKNMYGHTSECQVHSLEHERDVEEKFKSTRFSMIYLPEADQFEDRIVFDILKDQLRLVHVPEEDHQLICDCNPPENGEEHWLHDVFHKTLQQAAHDTADERDKTYAKKFRIFEFQLDDNTFLPEEKKEELKASFRYDRHKYARFVEGKWVIDQSRTHFADLFFPNIHVRGDTTSIRETDWDIIVPGKNSTTLVTGWDLGSVNHANIILCPRDYGEETAFDVIDETVVLEEKISVADFTELVLERMDFWELLLKEIYGHDRIRWRHWADSSAFSYRSSADDYDAMIVRKVSANRIMLDGVAKPAGSVKQRVNLLKKLLFDQRLFVSAQCRHTVEMLQKLRPGKTKSEVIDRVSPLKHTFDSLTYALSKEAPTDMERRTQPTVRPRMVSVPVLNPAMR